MILIGFKPIMPAVRIVEIDSELLWSIMGFNVVLWN